MAKKYNRTYGIEVEYQTIAGVATNTDSDFEVGDLYYHHQVVVDVNTAGTAGTAQVKAKPLGATDYVDIGTTVDLTALGSTEKSFSGYYDDIRVTTAAITGTPDIDLYVTSGTN